MARTDTLQDLVQLCSEGTAEGLVRPFNGTNYCGLKHLPESVSCKYRSKGEDEHGLHTCINLRYQPITTYKYLM